MFSLLLADIKENILYIVALWADFGTFWYWLLTNGDSPNISGCMATLHIPIISIIYLMVSSVY